MPVLHCRMHQLKSGQPTDSSDFPPGGLEVLGETRLSVSERITGYPHNLCACAYRNSPSIREETLLGCGQVFGLFASTGQTVGLHNAECLRLSNCVPVSTLPQCEGSTCAKPFAQRPRTPRAPPGQIQAESRHLVLGPFGWTQSTAPNPTSWLGSPLVWSAQHRSSPSPMRHVPSGFRQSPRWRC
jgi:hypothetical protein